MSELTLLRNLKAQMRRFRMTAPVDDDFPDVMWDLCKADDACNVISSTIPKIVCLCGSTKFKDLFIEKNYEFTKRGYIVLTVGWFSHAEDVSRKPSDKEKIALDALHFSKIELADEVYIINPDGYIGESTRNELDYAIKLGKNITLMKT